MQGLGKSTSLGTRNSDCCGNTIEGSHQEGKHSRRGQAKPQLFLSTRKLPLETLSFLIVGDFCISKMKGPRTSLVVQWLRLCALNAGGQGLIPVYATISHMPQLGVSMLKLKLQHAATKTQCSQKKFF